MEYQEYELQDASSSCRKLMKTVFFSCCRQAAFTFLFSLICCGFKPLIGAGFFTLMFQSRVDTFLQSDYFSATHFCPACAPTQAPLHPHAELSQGLPAASCAGKPNEFGIHKQGEHQCGASSKQEREGKKKAAGSKG